MPIPTSPTPKTLSDAMSMPPPRILVVDDTPTNVKVLTGILRHDYEILSAFSGEEGLHVASKQLPDLILLDVLMPGMNGFEVCERLKKDHQTRNIPVIFITALDEVEDEAKGFELGAVDYLTKPIRKPIVKARVRNHLELKRHRDFLEQLSTMDGLTGIPNRRHFDSYFDQEWRRAIRNKLELGLIIIDIDYFKMFNDRYGHLDGDDCLKTVAQALSKQTRRPMDFVARYGGEEFVAVLPETNLEGAKLLAEGMRAAVEALNIPHAEHPTKGHVTVSIGVCAGMPAQETQSTKMIDHADKALYQAKLEGRNRLVSKALDDQPAQSH